MKKIIDKTVFNCDYCDNEKVVNNIEEENNFPYEKSQYYLHSLNFQEPSSEEERVKNKNFVFKRHIIKDKHFCSLLCMHIYINLKLEELKNAGHKDT